MHQLILKDLIAIAYLHVEKNILRNKVSTRF